MIIDIIENRKKPQISQINADFSAPVCGYTDWRGDTRRGEGGEMVFW
jgi:hypothetical protein